ncbi:nucleotide exchange factor GrpE [Streptomyces sp. NPDC054765]
MNRPTNVRGLSQPPLAIVGHGPEASPGTAPSRATPAEEETAQSTGQPPGDSRAPGGAPGRGDQDSEAEGTPGHERDVDRPAGHAQPSARSVPPEAVLCAELRERTADLQRLKAEYDNYRKRVHRDRLAVGEIAVANVLSRLLPVLDSLAEAREQGEVTGGFQRVAQALETELGALGLQTFGAAGAPFDPLIHEAVTYTPDDQLEVATCTAVLRQGYRVGDRLLRPAQVTVAGEPPAGP